MPQGARGKPRSTFRQCGLVTYRQVALDKGEVWKLIEERTLREAVSAWTLSAAVAKTFKGGVPPEGWQGAIFAITPQPQNMIINLNSLYACPEFQEPLSEKKASSLDSPMVPVDTRTRKPRSCSTSIASILPISTRSAATPKITTRSSA